MTPKRLFLLSVLLIGLSASAWATEKSASTGANTPIPPAWKAAFEAVEADPHPEKLTRDSHYWVSDEQRHDLLADFARRWDKDASKQHQVWLPIQAKNVYSVEFLREKVEYTHNNPVAKRWCLVADRADYAYSSACFYDRGLAPAVEVDDVREWFG